MVPGPFALLYCLCCLSLAGLALFVLLKGGRRNGWGPRRTFFLLAISLVGWLVTLFLEVRTAQPGARLWLGRANFAAVVFAAYLALGFVRAVARPGAVRALPTSPVLLALTWMLAALSLLTPLVSTAERIEDGHAVTTFGPLFPGYLLFVGGCLGAAIATACRERRRTRDPRVRGQLTLIGGGMLLTGGVALITNALLPYGFRDFRFCHAGTLSTLFFVLAVAYATFVRGLFDLRVVVRETLVYGILLAFVLGAYSSTVFLLTQFLTDGAEKWTQFAVLLIAFSFDPLRRFLEEKTDRLLFGERGNPSDRRGRGSGKRGRSGNGLRLAILFPWHRQ